MSRTLQEVGTELELGDNEELFVSVDNSLMISTLNPHFFPPFSSSGQEVAVVYYRSGYGPEHYSSEKVSCRSIA